MTNPIREFTKTLTWHASTVSVYRTDLDKWANLIEQQRCKIEDLEAQLKEHQTNETRP